MNGRQRMHSKMTQDVEHNSSCVRIAPIVEEDLSRLFLHLAGDDADHASFLRGQQEAQGLYLVAWRRDVPVGHLYIRWAGSNEIPRIRDSNLVAATIADCPVLDQIWVYPNHRCQGIGSLLIRRAEEIVREHGFSRACITVNVGNASARALYERLGYRDPGIGEYHTTGTYVDDNGQEVPWDNGTQVCLVKRLDA